MIPIRCLQAIGNAVMSIRTTRFRRGLFAAIAAWCSVTLSLVGMEYSLRALDASDVKLLDYGDVISRTLSPGGQLIPDQDLEVTDGMGGRVRWRTNHAGFRNDREFQSTPPSDTRRVLSIGDSFGAGYRVGQADFYPALFEELANSRLGPTEVLAAVAEEPEAALRYMRSHGLEYDADVVALGVTLGNDFAQVYAQTRLRRTGATQGLDQFHFPERAVDPATGLRHSGLRARRWLGKQSLYQRLFDPPGIVSWYGRFAKRMLFDQANGLGMYLSEPTAAVQEAYQALFAVLLELRDELHRHEVPLVLLVIPQRFQVQAPDWRAAVRDYELHEPSFDLARPNRLLTAFAKVHQIPLIDPTQAMRARYEESEEGLYLPRRDMHWNRNGHRAFVRATWPGLQPWVEKSFAARTASIDSQ